MPITFNEDTNRFEGSNAFGETLEGLDFSVFGGLVSNSGAITGTITANSAEPIEFNNTFLGTVAKPQDSPFAIDLLGSGGRLISNDGSITGTTRLGSGWDSFFNTGLVQGQVRTGDGNDLVTNQIIQGIDGGPETQGTITGGLYMGNGDDTVLNTGVLGNVQLQGGNDTYTVGGFLDFGPGIEDDIEFGPIIAPLEENGIFGSAGDVRGGAGEDTLNGGTSDDRFFGGTDDDVMFGAGGRDQLFGQAGDDRLQGGTGNDLLNGGSGNDFLDGGTNNDRMFGSSGNDLMFAGNGNDIVNGGIGDDVMLGQRGNDRMTGGTGNDTLEGGQGRDTLIGGDGADVFVFAGRSNQDIIRDFSEGDMIELRLNTFDGGVTYDDVIANTTFTASNAIIDLSAIFNIGAAGGITDNGSSVVVRNATLEDLDASAFTILSDIFIAT